MREAVISDIHANLEAFTAVLADIDGRGVESILNLGDAIGYGPNPNRVVELLRERGVPSVLGNHELAVLDREQLDWFNPHSREALERTLRILTADTRAWIDELPDFIVSGDARYVHGLPPDRISRYLFTQDPDGLREAFGAYEERICFVGHTHELRIVEFDGQEATNMPLSRQGFTFVPDRRYIVNVGSVGQPRDDFSKQAKYVLWDREADTVAPRFVDYDAARTAEKIAERGLPTRYGDRLL
jgi:diadenosine tetraphosphatase ApaH/serine/threonine PP2A family protein phosphatase